MRKVLVYIAMSLDGYIARNDHSLDWLDSMQLGGEDYGYNQFLEGVAVSFRPRRSTCSNPSPGPLRINTALRTGRTSTSEDAPADDRDDAGEFVGLSVGVTVVGLVGEAETRRVSVAASVPDSVSTVTVASSGRSRLQAQRKRTKTTIQPPFK
jgi:hypothetical protein